MAVSSLLWYNNYKGEDRLATLGKHWTVSTPRTEEHKRKIGEAGTATRVLRRETGVYSKATKKGWVGLTPEERSKRTEPARLARKANLIQWPDGPHVSEYGPDWLEFRQEILKRDNYRCVLGCAKPGKRLEVHHLCYEPSCRNKGHMVTLCSTCHQGGHRRRAWPIELSRSTK